MSDLVTIKRSQLEALERDSEMYHALRAAGVDNWEGWNEVNSIDEETYEDIYGKD